MPKRGENIYKRKDGRWEARYKNPLYPKAGEARYKSVYASSYSKLKNALNEMAQQTENGENVKTKMSFEEFAEIWLQESAKPYVKRSTYALYRRTIQGHFFPMLGRINLSQLNSQDAEKFIQHQLKNGRIDQRGGLSEKTVYEQVNLLNTILSSAVKKEILRVNPLDGLRRPKILKKEMRVFSKDDQRKIENIILNSDNVALLGIVVCLYTGIRVGELCALRWKNIDFSQNTITVTNTLQRIQNFEDGTNKTSVILDSPKSRCSLRTLPMPLRLAQRLIQFYFSLPEEGRKPENYVFSHKGNSKNCIIEPRLYEKYFQSVLLNAGVEKANFHALRHTFATRCIELQMDVKSLSEILGHSNTSTTLNKYVHSFMDEKRRGIEKLNEIFVD